ncbi:MAG: NfeD family protein [Chromatiales bacterium]
MTIEGPIVNGVGKIRIDDSTRGGLREGTVVAADGPVLTVRPKP